LIAYLDSSMLARAYLSDRVNRDEQAVADTETLRSVIEALNG
jgi:hypothetical protein